MGGGADTCFSSCLNVCERPRVIRFQNAHADVGLITAMPLSAQPGLQLLQQVPSGHDPTGYRWEWVGIERSKQMQVDEGQEWVILSGEVLAVITGNGVAVSSRFGSIYLVLAYGSILCTLECCSRISGPRKRCLTFGSCSCSDFTCVSPRRNV